jgi:AcrR family transcriptional regulator
MRDGGHTRGLIEAAALRLFVEKGIDATGIRDIASAAGVSEGAMYRHYAGKEDLVRHLFTTELAGHARELERLQAGALGTRRKIEAIMRGFCALFDADSVLFRFILLIEHRQPRNVTADAANPVEIVRSVIESGMRSGEISSGDADLATAMVMGIVLQTARAVVHGDVRPPLSPLAPDLAAACWRVVSIERGDWR